MQTLVQSVHEKANSDLRKAIDAIEGVSISILGIGIEYSREKGSVNYQILLEKILVELRKRKLSLLIAIDEAGASREMKQFASVYQIMLRKNYPLSLVMTGLPRNISELQNDHTLTFLLRSARIDLPMLDPVSVQFSYQKVFADGGKTILQDCLRRMTELTNGYSYAFQLLGYLVWNTGAGEITGEVVDSVLYPYKEQLFRNAYSRIYEDLSGVDREFVLAMARAGEKTIAMKSITERMKKVPNYVSTYKRRLMEAGVVRADSYGYVSFALPLFDEYVREFRM